LPFRRASDRETAGTCFLPEHEIPIPNPEVNPLHRFHRVPDFEEPPLYLGTLLQAARIMDESFQGWSTCLDVKPGLPTSSARLYQRLVAVLIPGRQAKPEQGLLRRAGQ